MKTYQYLFYVLTIVFFTRNICYAISYRNILTYNEYDYANSDTSKVYENAFIYKFSSKYSVIFKLYQDNRSSWHNTIYTPGIVYVFNKHIYGSINYGYGIDSNDKRTDYYIAEINKEKPEYYAALEYKYSSYPDFFSHQISPAFRYYITSKSNVWSKLFLILDSDDKINYSFWGETDLNVYRKTSIILGGTFGDRLSGTEYERQPEENFYSLIAGISIKITEFAKLKILHENITKASNQTDSKNTAFFDISF